MSQVLSVFTYQVGYSALTRALVQAKNGDYLLAGRTCDANGRLAAFALRVRPNGSLAWTRSYPGEFDTFFASLAVLADGNFAATGTIFRSDNAGDEALWAVKLDGDGNIIWQRSIGQPGVQTDGNAVVAEAGGGFTAAGLSLPSGGRPATLVLNFDPDGKLEWDRSYPRGVAYAIAKSPGGGYVLSGAHNIPGSLNSHVYLLRLDKRGQRIWERVYEDTEIYVLLQSGVALTPDGNYAVAAKSVVMEVNGHGELLWRHRSDNLNLNAITAPPKGHLVAAGSLIANNQDHAYLAVLDPEGKAIKWDNTELLFNSGIAQVLVNSDGLVADGGYAPYAGDRSLVFLALFYQARRLPVG